MTLGEIKNPRFRVLCKRCNSYMTTDVEIDEEEDETGNWPFLRIWCECGNRANSFGDTFDDND